MGVLIIDEEKLEFGLLPAYQNFSVGARTFLEDQGLPSSGPASLIMFKILLIIVSSRFRGISHLSRTKIGQDAHGLFTLCRTIYANAIVHKHYIPTVIIVVLGQTYRQRRYCNQQLQLEQILNWAKLFWSSTNHCYLHLLRIQIFNGMATFTSALEHGRE